MKSGTKRILAVACVAIAMLALVQGYYVPESQGRYWKSLPLSFFFLHPHFLMAIGGLIGLGNDRFWLGVFIGSIPMPLIFLTILGNC